MPSPTAAPTRALAPPATPSAPGIQTSAPERRRRNSPYVLAALPVPTSPPTHRPAHKTPPKATPMARAPRCAKCPVIFRYGDCLATVAPTLLSRLGRCEERLLT